MILEQELLFWLCKVETEIEGFFEGLEVIADFAKCRTELLFDGLLLLHLASQLLYMDIGFLKLARLLFQLFGQCAFMLGG